MRRGTQREEEATFLETGKIEVIMIPAEEILTIRTTTIAAVEAGLVRAGLGAVPELAVSILANGMTLVRTGLRDEPTTRQAEEAKRNLGTGMTSNMEVRLRGSPGITRSMPGVGVTLITTMLRMLMEALAKSNEGATRTRELLDAVMILLMNIRM